MSRAVEQTGMFRRRPVGCDVCAPSDPAAQIANAVPLAQIEMPKGRRFGKRTVSFLHLNGNVKNKTSFEVMIEIGRRERERPTTGGRMQQDENSNYD
jgi:hypothetical protein